MVKSEVLRGQSVSVDREYRPSPRITRRGWNSCRGRSRREERRLVAGPRTRAGRALVGDVLVAVDGDRDDPRERRLGTGGRIVPEMVVRLFDGDEDVTESGVGQPACRGPATSLGYLGGTDHDKLFTRDGWMRMGDICAIDADGYLSVTGRTSDFIVRGGKNISASQVEDAVTTHPAIAVAAAVAMPDPVFGEKVCVYTETVGSRTVELPELVEHLLGRGRVQGTNPRTPDRAR